MHMFVYLFVCLVLRASVKGKGFISKWEQNNKLELNLH